MNVLRDLKGIERRKVRRRHARESEHEDRFLSIFLIRLFENERIEDRGERGFQNVAGCNSSVARASRGGPEKLLENGACELNCLSYDRPVLILFGFGREPQGEPLGMKGFKTRSSGDQYPHALLSFNGLVERLPFNHEGLGGRRQLKALLRFKLACDEGLGRSLKIPDAGGKLYF